MILSGRFLGVYVSELDRLYRDRYFKRRINRYDEKERKLSKVLFDLYHPKSVLDIGCGIGSYLCVFKELGCKVVGVDKYMNKAIKYVDPSIKKYMNCMDCGFSFFFGTKFDLVMCVEVAEHIKEECSEILVDNICKHAKKRILFSSAHPGQRGTGHITCKERYFWEDIFKDFDFFINMEETQNLCDNLNRNSPIPKDNVIVLSRR